MDEKINLTAVSYLNTKPLLYGLELLGLDQTMFNIKLENPSNCAVSLLNGTSTIGLVPVAMIPSIPNASIITDYCIGSDGFVKTVMLFSNTVIDEVNSIFLDNHSRTSAILTRILCEFYWKISPTFINNIEISNVELKANEAALVIGDKSIGLENKYKYAYDLSNIWKEMTGLPFVFAAWITTQKIERQTIETMNKAFELGISKINELVKKLVVPNFDILTYFKENISYRLDNQKKEALSLYWNMGKIK
ncbi:MAG: menaquinone biosynthesis protein [Saprospiraceae bacterium]|nr:menaquinone biosynthesis protein [Saprospiraceae bacterium]